MKTAMHLMVVSLCFVAATSAQASGFLCEGRDGYAVKLYNNTDPQYGTRTPAALVISREGEGTLLVRKGVDIRKNNRTHTVQYVVDGSEKLGADTAILQIAFKHGSTVEDAVDGQLILVKDGERNVLALQCERYLKN